MANTHPGRRAPLCAKIRLLHASLLWTFAKPGAQRAPHRPRTRGRDRSRRPLAEQSNDVTNHAYRLLKRCDLLAMPEDWAVLHDQHYGLRRPLIEGDGCAGRDGQIIHGFTSASDCDATSIANLALMYSSMPRMIADAFLLSRKAVYKISSAASSRSIWLSMFHLSIVR